LRVHEEIWLNQLKLWIFIWRLFEGAILLELALGKYVEASIIAGLLALNRLSSRLSSFHRFIGAAG
jgi:hypothetical protein